MLLDWRFDGFPGRVLWVDLTRGTTDPGISHMIG